MTVQPLIGVSGDRMTVVITPDGEGLGTQQIDILVVADDPEVGDGERTTPIMLRVLDYVRSTYLPVVLH